MYTKLPNAIFGITYAFYGRKNIIFITRKISERLQDFFFLQILSNICKLMYQLRFTPVSKQSWTRTLYPAQQEIPQTQNHTFIG